MNGASDGDHFMVYPNPSNGTYFVHPECEILGVFDALGKKVPYIINSDIMELTSAAGLYTMVLKTSQGSRSIRLVKW
jgi:hypothetical protein